MDESDSEAEQPQRRAGASGRGDAVVASAAPDVAQEKYPVDGIYISLAEKEEIMRMPELQRETILAERMQESERNRQNMLLRLLVNNQESEEKRLQQRDQRERDQRSRGGKRSADSADLEDGNQRKSSRQRTRLDGTKVGETSAAFEALRRARAEKSERQRRREEGRSSPVSRRDRDALPEEEEDDDWLNDRQKSRSPEKEITARELPFAELRDFERVRVGRRQFAEKCFDPGFEETLTGCYVRVAGDRDSSGENKYHMALIKGRASSSHTAFGGFFG